ncbi:hypothetical protein BC833DRAFT_594238 [Globomyces pollinis-pini]|nr:hypothetical protein BC833DRAFT_594238 [Globomyces pollinis-pini]
MISVDKFQCQVEDKLIRIKSNGIWVTDNMSYTPDYQILELKDIQKIEYIDKCLLIQSSML